MGHRYDVAMYQSACSLRARSELDVPSQSGWFGSTSQRLVQQWPASSRRSEQFGSVQHGGPEAALWTGSSGGKHNFVVGIPTTEQYDVISHVWGNTTSLTPGFAVPRYAAGGVPACSRDKLLLIDRISRRNGARALWCDILSIDQSSQRDKCAQVSVMDKIYRGASTCFTILDDSTLHAIAALKSACFKGVEWDRACCPACGHMPSEVEAQVGELYRAVRAIQSESHNRRVWTLQESVLSANVVYTSAGTYPKTVTHRQLTSLLDIAVYKLAVISKVYRHRLRILGHADRAHIMSILSGDRAAYGNHGLVSGICACATHQCVTPGCGTRAARVSETIYETTKRLKSLVMTYAVVGRGSLTYHELCGMSRTCSETKDYIAGVYKLILPQVYIPYELSDWEQLEHFMSALIRFGHVTMGKAAGRATHLASESEPPRHNCWFPCQVTTISWGGVYQSTVRRGGAAKSLPDAAAFSDVSIGHRGSLHVRRAALIELSAESVESAVDVVFRSAVNVLGVSPGCNSSCIRRPTRGSNSCEHSCYYSNCPLLQGLIGVADADAGKPVKRPIKGCCRCIVSAGIASEVFANPGMVLMANREFGALALVEESHTHGHVWVGSVVSSDGVSTSDNSVWTGSSVRDILHRTPSVVLWQLRTSDIYVPVTLGSGAGDMHGARGRSEGLGGFDVARVSELEESHVVLSALKQVAKNGKVFDSSSARLVAEVVVLFSYSPGLLRPLMLGKPLLGVPIPHGVDTMLMSREAFVVLKAMGSPDSLQACGAIEINELESKVVRITVRSSLVCLQRAMTSYEWFAVKRVRSAMRLNIVKGYKKLKRGAVRIKGVDVDSGPVQNEPVAENTGASTVGSSITSVYGAGLLLEWFDRVRRYLETRSLDLFEAGVDKSAAPPVLVVLESQSELNTVIRRRMPLSTTAGASAVYGKKTARSDVEVHTGSRVYVMSKAGLAIKHLTTLPA